MRNFSIQTIKEWVSVHSTLVPTAYSYTRKKEKNEKTDVYTPYESIIRQSHFSLPLSAVNHCCRAASSSSFIRLSRAAKSPWKAFFTGSVRTSHTSSLLGPVLYLMAFFR